jgi:hypothetical protein
MSEKLIVSIFIFFFVSMKVVDVCIDWTGRYGLIHEDGSIAWIISVCNVTYMGMFTGICLADNNVIEMTSFSGSILKLNCDQIQTSPIWEHGSTMQIGAPETHVFSRAPGITMVTGNGNCYVTDDDIDHVLVGNNDVYQIDLSTGHRRFPKLEPNYTHRLRYSDSFDTVLRLVRFDHCEMTSAGLLRIITPNKEVFYSELYKGETLQYDSDCIVTSSHERMFCVKLDFMNNPVLQVIDMRLPGRYVPAEPTVLHTFYRDYFSRNGVFVLPNAKVIKPYDRITEVKTLGEKTKPALH